MHFYSKLALCLSLSLITACQSQFVKVQNNKIATSKVVSATDNNGCIDYQSCIQTGVLRTLGSGLYLAAYLEMKDGNCIPLLLDKKLIRQSSIIRNRTAKVNGLTFPRLPDGDENTLSVKYFDRNLPSGVCTVSRQIIYVRYIKPG
jgi:hypothetical protein